MSKKPDLECMSEDQLQRLRDKIDQQLIEPSELRRAIDHLLVGQVGWKPLASPLLGGLH